MHSTIYWNGQFSSKISHKCLSVFRLIVKLIMDATVWLNFRIICDILTILFVCFFTDIQRLGIWYILYSFNAIPFIRLKIRFDPFKWVFSEFRDTFVEILISMRLCDRKIQVNGASSCQYGQQYCQFNWWFHSIGLIHTKF